MDAIGIQHRPALQTLLRVLGHNKLPQPIAHLYMGFDVLRTASAGILLVMFAAPASSGLQELLQFLNIFGFHRMDVIYGPYAWAALFWLMVALAVFVLLSSLLTLRSGLAEVLSGARRKSSAVSTHGTGWSSSPFVRPWAMFMAVMYLFVNPLMVATFSRVLVCETPPLLAGNGSGWPGALAGAIAAVKNDVRTHVLDPAGLTTLYSAPGTAPGSGVAAAFGSCWEGTHLAAVLTAVLIGIPVILLLVLYPLVLDRGPAVDHGVTALFVMPLDDVLASAVTCIITFIIAVLPDAATIGAVLVTVALISSAYTVLQFIRPRRVLPVGNAIHLFTVCILTGCSVIGWIAYARGVSTESSLAAQQLAMQAGSEQGFSFDGALAMALQASDASLQQAVAAMFLRADVDLGPAVLFGAPILAAALAMLLRARQYAVVASALSDLERPWQFYQWSLYRLQIAHMIKLAALGSEGAAVMRGGMAQIAGRLGGSAHHRSASASSRYAGTDLAAPRAGGDGTTVLSKVTGGSVRGHRRRARSSTITDDAGRSAGPSMASPLPAGSMGSGWLGRGWGLRSGTSALEQLQRVFDRAFSRSSASSATLRSGEHTQHDVETWLDGAGSGAITWNADNAAMLQHAYSMSRDAGDAVEAMLQRHPRSSTAAIMAGMLHRTTIIGSPRSAELRALARAWRMSVLPGQRVFVLLRRWAIEALADQANSSASSLSGSQRVEFELHMANARAAEVAAHRAVVAAWAVAQSAQPSMAQLQQLAIAFMQSRTKAAAHFERLVSTHSSSPEVLRAHAAFLRGLLHDDAAAQAALERADRLERAAIDEHDTPVQLFTLGSAPSSSLSVDDSAGVLVLSAGEGDFGSVVAANVAAQRVVGRGRSDMLSASVTALMPQPWSSLSPQALADAVQGRENFMRLGWRWGLVQHSSGALQPVKFGLEDAPPSPVGAPDPRVAVVLSPARVAQNDAIGIVRAVILHGSDRTGMNLADHGDLELAGSQMDQAYFGSGFTWVSGTMELHDMLGTEPAAMEESLMPVAAWLPELFRELDDDPGEQDTNTHQLPALLRHFIACNGALKKYTTALLKASEGQQFPAGTEQQQQQQQQQPDAPEQLQSVQVVLSLQPLPLSAIAWSGMSSELLGSGGFAMPGEGGDSSTQRIASERDAVCQRVARALAHAGSPSSAGSPRSKREVDPAASAHSLPAGVVVQPNGDVAWYGLVQLRSLARRERVATDGAAKLRAAVGAMRMMHRSKLHGSEPGADMPSMGAPPLLPQGPGNPQRGPSSDAGPPRSSPTGQSNYEGFPSSSPPEAERALSYKPQPQVPALDSRSRTLNPLAARAPRPEQFTPGASIQQARALAKLVDDTAASQLAPLRATRRVFVAVSIVLVLFATSGSLSYYFVFHKMAQQSLSGAWAVGARSQQLLGIHEHLRALRGSVNGTTAPLSNVLPETTSAVTTAWLVALNGGAEARNGSSIAELQAGLQWPTFLVGTTADIAVARAWGTVLDAAILQDARDLTQFAGRQGSQLSVLVNDHTLTLAASGGLGIAQSDTAPRGIDAAAYSNSRLDEVPTKVSSILAGMQSVQSLVQGIEGAVALTTGARESAVSSATVQANPRGELSDWMWNIRNALVPAFTVTLMGAKDADMAGFLDYMWWQDFILLLMMIALPALVLAALAVRRAAQLAALLRAPLSALLAVPQPVAVVAARQAKLALAEAAGLEDTGILEEVDDAAAAMADDAEAVKPEDGAGSPAIEQSTSLPGKSAVFRASSRRSMIGGSRQKLVGDISVPSASSGVANARENRSFRAAAVAALMTPLALVALYAAAIYSVEYALFSSLSDSYMRSRLMQDTALHTLSTRVNLLSALEATSVDGAQHALADALASAHAARAAVTAGVWGTTERLPLMQASAAFSSSSVFNSSASFVPTVLSAPPSANIRALFHDQACVDSSVYFASAAVGAAFAPPVSVGTPYSSSAAYAGGSDPILADALLNLPPPALLGDMLGHIPDTNALRWHVARCDDDFGCSFVEGLLPKLRVWLEQAEFLAAKLNATSLATPPDGNNTLWARWVQGAVASGTPSAVEMLWTWTGMEERHLRQLLSHASAMTVREGFKSARSIITLFHGINVAAALLIPTGVLLLLWPLALRLGRAVQAARGLLLIVPPAEVQNVPPVKAAFEELVRHTTTLRGASSFRRASAASSTRS